MSIFSQNTTHILRDILRHPEADDSPSSVKALQQILHLDTRTAHRSTHGQLFRWWMNAAMVMEHAQLTGHPPTASEGATNQILCWIRNQRRARLDPLKEVFLDTVPGWDWAPRTSHWEERVEQLATFVAQHDRRPSTHSRSKQERSLANWMQYQCLRLRTKPYPRDRANRLRAIPYVVPFTDGA